MNAALPTSIPAYLEHLRKALAGADPAMIQDALYDAEEYLRSEMAENPGKTEADVIASVASSYGAPEEVADIYRDTEATVQAALRPPTGRPAIPQRLNTQESASVPTGAQPLYSGSALRRIFGVFTDPRTYGALFYMLLSLATGIFYFTWTVTGISLSAGLAILIIGLPFMLLFVGASRVLSLVEGRIVEVMLGERMPRRVAYQDRDRPLLTRIKDMLTDPRTWSTYLYFMLMLPLGTLYFSLVTIGLTSALAFIGAPFAGGWFQPGPWQVSWFGMDVSGNPVVWGISVLVGVVLLVATFHLARLIGVMHGRIAKHLLVNQG